MTWQPQGIRYSRIANMSIISCESAVE
jgi:hypothetical protein